MSIIFLIAVFRRCCSSEELGYGEIDGSFGTEYRLIESEYSTEHEFVQILLHLQYIRAKNDELMSAKE